MEWMPHVVEGKHAQRWSLGDYDIVPLDDQLRPRYVVRFQGEDLPGDPCCLSRARQRAEAHMIMGPSSSSPT